MAEHLPLCHRVGPCTDLGELQWQQQAAEAVAAASTRYHPPPPRSLLLLMHFVDVNCIPTSILDVVSAAGWAAHRCQHPHHQCWICLLLKLLLGLSLHDNKVAIDATLVFTQLPVDTQPGFVGRSCWVMQQHDDVCRAVMPLCVCRRCRGVRGAGVRCCLTARRSQSRAPARQWTLSWRW